MCASENINKSRRGGNACRTHMLSGRAVCETCSAPMQMNGGKPKEGHPAYYSCGRHRESISHRGESLCTRESFKVPVAEEATVRAIEDAAAHPETIVQIIAAYKTAQPPTPDGEDVRREIAAIERALNTVTQDEAIAVQGQIAGIRAGASPNAYAAVFADLAARRKDLEDRRGVLRRAHAPVRAAGRLTNAAILDQAIADVGRVLRSPDVSEMVKRQAVGMVVEKVYCRRDGAVVTFLPGAFAETADTLKDIRCSFF